MPTLRTLYAVFLLVALAAPSLALAADEKEQYPAVVTGEADFTEGDLEKSRREAREDALRKAVRGALEGEVGRAALENNPVVVRTRFLNVAADFMKRFGVMGETKAGFRLRVTYGYEFDLAKLRARIQAVKLQAVEGRPRLVYVWSEESRGEGETAPPTHRATAWTEGVTEPAAVAAVRDVLAANGFDVRDLSAPDRAWARGVLRGEDPTKAFLAEAAQKSEARAAVFLRIVHRPVVTPPAARFDVVRDHHVAFVYDVTTGVLAAPIDEAVVRTEGEGSPAAAGLSAEWTNRLLQLLIAEEKAGTRLVVRGVSSAGVFDATWTKLRKLEALGDVVPRRLATGDTIFEFTGAGEGAAAALEAAFPGATVAEESGALILTLPPKKPK